MTEFLTPEQITALDSKHQRIIAKTVLEYVGFAQSIQLSEKRISETVAEINTWDDKRLKHARKSLVAAAKLPEIFEGNQISIFSQAVTINDGAPSVLSESEAIRTDLDDRSETVVTSETLLDSESKDLLSDELSSSQSIGQELSHPKGIKLVQNLLGSEYNPTGKTLDEIATEIYQKAGSPTSFVNQRKDQPVNGVNRIRLRLMGLSNTEAALEEGVTMPAFQVWFSVNIAKRIRTTLDDDSSVQQTSSEIEHTEPVVPEMSHELRLYDGPATAERLNTLFEDLSDEERIAFESLVATEKSTDLPDNIVALHDIAAKILISKIPSSLDEVLLKGQEKTLIRKLLGLYQQGGRPNIKPPIPVSSILTSKLPNTEKDLASGMDKLLDYLEKNKIITDNSARKVEEPEQVADAEKLVSADSNESLLRTQLMHAKFSETEALALETCFEFDGDSASSKDRHEDATAALNLLQSLLVKNLKNIENHPGKPGLRMLSNTVFGQKTVQDVYYSMHKLDTSITPIQVTEILKECTLLLIGSDISGR